MEDQYGSDFMTIVDEDGTEFELEILSTLEYNGCTYLAVIPAGADEEEDLEVSILNRVLSGHTPEEIVNTQLYFIDDIQLREHLSPTRSNGLNAMLRKMIEYALHLTNSTN